MSETFAASCIANGNTEFLIMEIRGRQGCMDYSGGAVPRGGGIRSEVPPTNYPSIAATDATGNQHQETTGPNLAIGAIQC